MQYPVLRIVQSAWHFISLTDLFTQTPSRLLWEASSHMRQLMREGCSYTYPLLCISRYSFIQQSELEQCRLKNLAQGFNTTAQSLNPGSRSREFEALPLSHCALQIESYSAVTSGNGEWFAFWCSSIYSKAWDNPLPIDKLFILRNDSPQYDQPTQLLICYTSWHSTQRHPFMWLPDHPRVHGTPFSAASTILGFPPLCHRRNLSVNPPNGLCGP